MSKSLTAVSAGRAEADWAALKGKRVAMVLFAFYPHDSRPRRAAEALIAAGMSVDMICIRDQKEELRREVYHGVNILRLPVTHRRGGVLGYLYKYTAFLLLSAWIIAYRTLWKRYDLIYVNNMPDVLALCGLLPRALGAKVILDLHDPMPELLMTIFNLPKHSKMVRMLEYAERWSIGLVDSVVTVNRACARLFASRSCPPQKITVIMNSPDENRFELKSVFDSDTSNTGNRRFVIMYHGSVVERNGLDLLVEAFAKLRSSIPNAELRIYGDQSAFLKRVMESVRSLGLEDRVKYLGNKSTEEIVKAIDQCDLGVIPNQRNIFTELNTPTRIFEYLAMGKPVIAPRAPGICDYFDDNSLIFFELGNAEELARQIEYVYQNPKQVMEVTARGQEIHQEHTWREEKLKLFELTSELLSDDRPRVVSN